MTDQQHISQADAVARLQQGDCSLVVLSAGRITLFHHRGVKDLLDLLEQQPELLSGAFVADKVVGKGAAALMVCGGVKAVYAGVISRPALAIFEESGCEVSYGSLVPNIINRMGTGICPVEQLCLGCTTAAECLPLIKDFCKRQ